MRVNNNYIRVVATFIGEDGSREFKKGTMYILKMKITDSYIIVSSENNESLWCPYGSMNTFLENWKLNKGEDEMSEFTEKLNSSELVSKAWDEIDRDQACAGLLIDTISNEFKDWQPPKPLVVVPQFVADWFRGLSYNSLEKYILNDVRKMNEKEVYLFTDFEKWFITSKNPIETILKMKDGYEVEEK